MCKTERADVLLLNLLNFTRILLVWFTVKDSIDNNKGFLMVFHQCQGHQPPAAYTSKHRQIIYYLLPFTPSLFHFHGKWERDKHNGWSFFSSIERKTQRTIERKRDRENNLKNEISSMTLANWMRTLVKRKVERTYTLAR